MNYYHHLVERKQYVKWGAQTLEREFGGFETYLSHVVSLSKTLCSPKVLVIPRKWWLLPDMTEKLLTGTLSLNTNKSMSSTNNIRIRSLKLNICAYSAIFIQS